MKVLEDQIKANQKEQRVLDDRSKILSEQRGFVQRMLQASTAAPAAPAPGAAPAARPTLDEWQRLFSYSDETLGKIAAEQRTVDQQKEDLQAKEGALTQQLRELRGARGRQSKRVSVRLALTAAGRLEVSLRYAVPNAGWTPSYDARLRSADRTVDLAYFGNVQIGRAHV